MWDYEVVYLKRVENDVLTISMEEFNRKCTELGKHSK